MSNEETMVMDTTTENNEDVEVTYMEAEESGSGLVKIAVGVGLALVGAAGVALYKTKELREQHQIKRLEKRGYVVLPSSEVKEVVEVDEDFEEEAVPEEK